MARVPQAGFQNSGSLEVLKKLCHEGQFHEALDTVGLLCRKVHCGLSTIFSRLLQSCIENGDLIGGRAVHSLIAKSGLESDTILGSYLIRMFASDGRLIEASQALSNMGMIRKPWISSSKCKRVGWSQLGLHLLAF